MKTTFLAACLLLTAALAASASPEHVYPNSFRAAVEFGSELCEVLKPQFKKQLEPQPVCMGPMDSPVITPVASAPGNATLGQVFISAGLIDLLNHLAHAKAIDDIQPGFFQQYAQALGKPNASEAPEIEEPRFWTETLMNTQQGYFNQMMGAVTAINLSHDYLGHVRKYASSMPAASLTPINDLLTPAEWKASVKAGVRNALDLSLGTAGIKAVFEAIDSMPKRPAWTAYIAPSQADLKEINEELTAMENGYFHEDDALAGNDDHRQAPPAGTATADHPPDHRPTN